MLREIHTSPLEHKTFNVFLLNGNRNLKINLKFKIRNPIKTKMEFKFNF